MKDPNKDPLISGTNVKWILDFTEGLSGAPHKIDLLIPYPPCTAEAKQGLWLSARALEVARQRQADFLSQIESLQDNLHALREGLYKSRKQAGDLNAGIRELYEAVEEFNEIIRKFKKKEDEQE